MIMINEIYLIKGFEDESYQAFSKRIVAFANDLAKNNEIQKLKVVYSAAPPLEIAVIPFTKRKNAALSVYLNSETEEPFLNAENGLAGKYGVEEAIPLACDKNGIMVNIPRAFAC